MVESKSQNFQNLDRPVTSQGPLGTQNTTRRVKYSLFLKETEWKVEIWHLGYCLHGEFDGGVKIAKLSKFGPICDVTGSPGDPKYHKKGQIFLISQGDWMKSWNLAFKLLSSWGIRWWSQNRKMFRIWTHLWRHRVPWGTKIPQEVSNILNFSRRLNEKFKFGIYITFVMGNSMVDSNFQYFQYLDISMTS
jgi:hypothetical protein